MKNFLVLLCFLCCHIIVIECSFEELSNQLGIPLDLVTQCAEHAAVTDTELTTYYGSPIQDLLSTLGADILSKIGCFFACLFQKVGMMEGAELKMEVWTEVLQSFTDNDSDMRDRMEIAVEVCGDEVYGAQDSCVVARTFRECMVLRMDPEQ